MKHIYLLFGLFLFTAPIALKAQEWGNLGPLLELFTQDEENNFNNELEGLSDSLLFDRFDGLRLSDFDLGFAQDSLFYYINNGGIDQTDSLSQFWLLNQNDLDSLLATGQFSPDDSTSISESFFGINETWYTDYDSLNIIIGSYSDTLTNVDSIGITDGNIRWEQFSGPWHQSYRLLENSIWQDLIDGTSNQGIDSIGEVLDTTLFNSLFDFEIAYGQEWSQVNFYGEQYQTRASMIRVANVPKLRQNFESRWALEGSFFANTEDLYGENNANLVEGLNPFICNGNFAIMYLPKFGSIGSHGEFRLYTSIGMDLGTYIPAHADTASPLLADRVGKTTGYGPQIGAGFVINYSNLSFYSYGTVAHGDIVEENNLGYRYNASTINAGIRFGDTVNVRYTLGESSWAPMGGKTASFSRFTVGIILDRLFL